MPVLFRHLANLPASLHGAALSIGNFDGVHLGHARIVARLQAMAVRLGGPRVILTFDPPPARILRPERAPTPLSWTERKAELLAELGIDAVVAYPTDPAFLQLEPREFFDRIVRDQLRARGMVEGPNFYFGRRRAGTIDVLRQYCDEAAIPMEVIEPALVAGQVVSSSRIRELISAGRIDEACALLTRPYRIRGVVVHGQGRGNRLGFPTANLGRVDTLVPGEGIYAGRAWIAGAAYPTALSVGPNPTFDEQEHKIEAFLLDYAGDLYDQSIAIDFLSRLRNVMRFDSPEELIEQMAEDVARTRAIAMLNSRKSQSDLGNYAEEQR